MLKTLINALKTGNATTQYPAAPMDLPYGFRGKPEHDEKQCIACAACASACPPNAIQMTVDESAGTIVWNINYGRCIFCGRCEEVCPFDAIKLGNEFELAVMAAEDLEESSTYLLEHCAACGKPFAPRKQVAYAEGLLKNISGIAGEELDASLAKLRVCPTCKRTMDAKAAQAVSRIEGGR
ncbi:formate hydrogenlyase complex iron-sulfur subunit [Slackia exigua]|uniref:formate hydrogenlyase complex iron-sulfur subunit n=1 Tax=Slackia exigua TaxID=84109 RepID=UPI0028D71F5D|nr:formate hydrogenlyase complex iron-sulfur subunit [Slackia exigua]